MSSRRSSRRSLLPALLLLLFVGVLMPTMVWAAAAPLDAPVLRRAIVAVVCLLGGFTLCLRGLDRFEQRKRWRGVGFVASGWVLGIGALSLLGLSENPQTWNWWI